MALPTKLDYNQQGLDRLLAQFRGKPNIEALLSSYLKQANLTQDAMVNAFNFKTGVLRTAIRGQ